MDPSGVDTANIDLSKLTDRDKQELQAFITNETQASLSAAAFKTGKLMCFPESKNSTMLVNSLLFHFTESFRALPYSGRFNAALGRRASTASLEPSHLQHWEYEEIIC